MSTKTVSLKLVTSAEQASGLCSMAEAYAKACDMIAAFAREHRCWNRVALHHLAYYPVREAMPALGSQMVCQAVHRVADTYKTLKANGKIRKDRPVPSVAFQPTSVSYDKRTYSIQGDTLSLFTPSGRARIPFVCGKHQRDLMASGTPKEARLVVRKGVWYFNLALYIPDVAPVQGSGVIGVDVGENNLAATSTGKVWGGGKLRHDRDKHLAQRSSLQSNGSRAAKRKLKAISGREERHVKHINHETSKAIVTEALRAGTSEIRMEDLTHIRASIKAGKRIRARLHRWAFRQLQDFVDYKAKATGLLVIYIDPAYTSQTCSVCGAIGKRERHRFSCACGTRLHADVNASKNIAGFAMPIGLARGVRNSSCIFAHQASPPAAKSPSP